MCDVCPFPLSPSYGVTPDGRVQRLDTGRWLKPCRLKRGGYLAVSLWENGRARTWPVHVIVACTFHGPRPSPKHDAAHRDGDKENNHYTNIRWATRVENENDKVAHGRTNRGERNGQAKLTDAQAREIIAACAAGETQAAVGRRYGIDQGHVSNIVRGKRRFAEAGA